jgi:hypothetical protein
MDNQNEYNSTMQNNYSPDGLVQSNIVTGIPESQGTNQQNNFMFNSIVDSLSGWMKFFGILTIISGALTCIGIITAAMGIPVIFAGISLVKGSQSLKAFKQYNSPYLLNEIFTYLNKYFKIQGILAIIGIALLIIYIIVLIFIVVLSFNGYIDNYNNYEYEYKF